MAMNSESLGLENVLVFLEMAFLISEIVHRLLTQISMSTHFLHHMHFLSLHMWMSMKVLRKYMVKGIREEAVQRCAAWVSIQLFHLLASLHLCLLKCKMRNNNNLKRLLKGTSQFTHAKSLAKYLTYSNIIWIFAIIITFKSSLVTQINIYFSQWGNTCENADSSAWNHLNNLRL